MFTENPKEPALIISDFRRDTKGELPVLKAAFVDGDVFAGNNQLETLKALKSKQDLIGEIIGLLQSPAKNVISALNAGGKLASLVKALEERAQA
jgi:large subunit ribosomal protein L10